MAPGFAGLLVQQGFQSGAAPGSLGMFRPDL
jgi:hypothetical protein